jgi:hypothetical protein
MSSHTVSLDALDDALLLQIFSTVARGGSDNDLAEPQRRADEAAKKPLPAWHPAHLARIACVSRCDAAGMCKHAHALVWSDASVWPRVSCCA